MTIPEKLREAVEAVGGRHSPVARREIIRYFKQHFPEVAEGSILPADHCINLVRGRKWDRDMGLPSEHYFLHSPRPGYYEIYDPVKHGPPGKWLESCGYSIDQRSRSTPTDPPPRRRWDLRICEAPNAVGQRPNEGERTGKLTIQELWHCGDEAKWREAWDYSWSLSKPERVPLEKKMETL